MRVKRGFGNSHEGVLLGRGSFHSGYIRPPFQQVRGNPSGIGGGILSKDATRMLNVDAAFPVSTAIRERLQFGKPPAFR